MAWLRKCLDWKTPIEVFLQEVSHLVSQFRMYLKEISSSTKNKHDIFNTYSKRLAHMQFIHNNMPLGLIIFNKALQLINCNLHLSRLLNARGKDMLMQDIYSFMPEYQENGKESKIFFIEKINNIFNLSFLVVNCLFCDANKALVPVQISFWKTSQDGYLSI